MYLSRKDSWIDVATKTPERRNISASKATGQREGVDRPAKQMDREKQTIDQQIKWTESSACMMASRCTCLAGWIGEAHDCGVHDVAQHEADLHSDKTKYTYINRVMLVYVRHRK